MFQVRMTYTNPEQLYVSATIGGRPQYSRIPNHPTRPAYPWEINAWWEDVEGDPIELAKRLDIKYFAASFRNTTPPSPQLISVIEHLNQRFPDA